MKNTIFLLAFLALSITISAQSEAVTSFSNLEMAKEYAAANNKDILMVFAGSDWCKPCMQFKKDILENTEFQNWAKEELVVLYLDFPSRKKNKLSKEQTEHNEALAERFNKSGAFPNILLLNTEEKVICNPEFKHQSAEAFMEDLKKGREG